MMMRATIRIPSRVPTTDEMDFETRIWSHFDKGDADDLALPKDKQRNCRVDFWIRRDDEWISSRRRPPREHTENTVLKDCCCCPRRQQPLSLSRYLLVFFFSSL